MIADEPTMNTPAAFEQRQRNILAQLHNVADQLDKLTRDNAHALAPSVEEGLSHLAANLGVILSHQRSILDVILNTPHMSANHPTP